MHPTGANESHSNSKSKQFEASLFLKITIDEKIQLAGSIILGIIGNAILFY